MSLIYCGRNKFLIICITVYAPYLFIFFTHADVLKITVPCIEHYLTVYNKFFTVSLYFIGPTYKYKLIVKNLNQLCS